MIDPTFKNINCLFFHSQMAKMFLREFFFDKYNMSPVEIKDFNALIDNKSFFDVPIKNKREAYEKLVEMSRNNDYTTGN